jgi:50S ribosomal protein L16 3-hydroxylase
MDLMPPEDLYTPDQVAQLIDDSDEVFERLGGTRAIYQVTNNELIFSVNGQNFLLPKTDLAAVKLLTDDVSMTAEQIKSSKYSLKFIQSFTTLLNEGIWFS